MSHTEGNDLDAMNRKPSDVSESVMSKPLQDVKEDTDE